MESVVNITKTLMEKIGCIQLFSSFHDDQHTLDKTPHMLYACDTQIYFGIGKSLVWKRNYLDLTKKIYHLDFFATIISCVYWVIFQDMSFHSST